MKKYALFLMLATVTCGAIAQPALGRGRETKLVDAVELASDLYTGQYGKLDCWLTEGKKHTLKFVMYNQDLVEQYGVTLPKSGEFRALAASMDATSAGVLVADQTEKRRTVLGRYRVTLAGCTVEDERMDTLAVFDYEKKDECKVWGAVSPSGNHMAVVAVVEYTEKHEYGTYIALFDAAGNELWNKEFALGTMSDLAVTDDGRVVTLGKEVTADGEQCIVVNLLTRDNARSSKMFMKSDPLQQLRLAAVHGSHLLAVGVFADGSSKKTSHLSAGVLAMSFNLDSATISSFTMRLFNNEEINILYNKDTKKIQKDLTCDSYELLDVAPTSRGCAALFGRRYRIEYTNSAGLKVYDYVCQGLNCMSVDTMARIEWVRNIRRNDLQEEEGDLLGANVMEADGRICVVKSEHKKYPAVYDVAKEGKELKMGGKANTVLYSINQAGEVQKIVVEKSVKQNLVRTWLRHDGSLLMLSKCGSKSRSADLKFHY